jgi:dTDP-4-dehydrorhamnose reductase
VRALVTGASGQVGVELLRNVPPDVEVRGLSHLDCDIINPGRVGEVFESERPDLVINAAAYTGVDAAESTPDAARAANAAGAGNVARAAERIGARLIHISTDYVFDGRATEPYRHDDEPNPINEYGATKLAGEREVRLVSSFALVLRSGWIYASHGKNFLRTILSALQGSRPLRIVDDQIGVPTSARSLAATIWACARRPDIIGIQHWTDGGTASWYDFAVAIQDIALARGIVRGADSITPVSSSEYGALAQRPAYSVLDARPLASALGRVQRPWRSELEDVIRELA